MTPLALIPPQSFFAITPSDANQIPIVRAIYVGGAGNIAIKGPGMVNAVTFIGVPVGTTLMVSAQYVMATNTTATNLVGLV